MFQEMEKPMKLISLASLAFAALILPAPVAEAEMANVIATPGEMFFTTAHAPLTPRLIEGLSRR
jgi:hypothetical protein